MKGWICHNQCLFCSPLAWPACTHDTQASQAMQAHLGRREWQMVRTSVPSFFHPVQLPTSREHYDGMTKPFSVVFKQKMIVRS